MRVESKNIFVTALSAINLVANFEQRRATQLCMYKNLIDDGKEDERIPGIFSGEAALRYYIRKSIQNGNCPDRYLFLCTNQVLNLVEEPKTITINDIKRAISIQKENELSKTRDHEHSSIRAAYDENEKIISDTMDCMKEMNLDCTDDTPFSTYDYVKAIVYYETADIFADKTARREYAENSSSIQVMENGEKVPFILMDWIAEDAVLKFMEKMLSDFKECEKINVSMDLTGGSRLSNLSALLVTQWFENNWNASIDYLFYSESKKITNENYEYRLHDWLKSYRKFNIKNFNMEGLTGRWDAKTDAWLHDFISGIDVEYLFRSEDKSTDLEKTEKKVNDLINELKKDDFSAAKINALNLCYKALTKTDILRHKSVREYVEAQLDKPYLFISYSHKNIEEIYRDVQTFKKKRISFVYDIILELFLGIDWDKVIGDYLESENCKVVLFYLSKESLSSPSVYEEILKVRKLVKLGKKRFYPIQLWQDSRSPESFIEDLDRNGELQKIKETHADAAEVLKEFFNKPTGLTYKSGDSKGDPEADPDKEPERKKYLDQLEKLHLPMIE